MKIHISQDYDLNYSAIDADTYDVDWEGEETGYVALGPVGRGATEEFAIGDLLQQLEDEHAS